MTNIKLSRTRGAFARQFLSGASLAAVVAATMMLTACGSGSSAESTTPSATGADKAASVSFNEGAAGLLPAEYKGKTLTVAFEAGNLPWSDFTADKSGMQGLDNDLMQAIGTVLGVQTKYEGTSFTNIIPGVQGGRYDIAADVYATAERQKIVDQTSYAKDGQAFIGKKGGGKTGLTEDTLCGLRVAASASTIAATALPKRSEKCVSEGKQPIDVQIYPSQGEIYLAVTSGRADVYNSASSNAGYLMKTSPGTFELSGPIYAEVPVSIVTKKDSKLGEAVAAALEVIAKSGAYAETLEKWGLKDAAIDKFEVNPATAK